MIKNTQPLHNWHSPLLKLLAIFLKWSSNEIVQLLFEQYCCEVICLVVEKLI